MIHVHNQVPLYSTNARTFGQETRLQPLNKTKNGFNDFIAGRAARGGEGRWGEGHTSSENRKRALILSAVGNRQSPTPLVKWRLRINFALIYISMYALKNSAPQDFKGFILPVGARSEAGVGPSSVPDEASFLTRGNSLRRRVGLDDATVQGDEQTRSRQHSRRNLFLVSDM